MKARYRHLTYLVLTAALIAPVALGTRAAAQDDKRQDESQHNDKKQVRVYDRTHKDYHNWNDNEDRSYRLYLGQNHVEYRDYSKLNHTRQNQYWNWRHSHPD
jgi:Ni/Co efflux regulator RcnB